MGAVAGVRMLGSWSLGVGPSRKLGFLVPGAWPQPPAVKLGKLPEATFGVAPLAGYMGPGCILSFL